MRIQVIDFVKKYKSSQDKSKIKKNISAKNDKVPKEVKDLYVSLNELFTLAKDSTPKKDNRFDIVVKILITFRECLKSQNYDRW